jgi:hypothetical protein
MTTPKTDLDAVDDACRRNSGVPGPVPGIDAKTIRAMSAELRRLRDIEAAAAEVWASVPASDDPADPMVTYGHPRPLNALGDLLKGGR